MGRLAAILLTVGAVLGGAGTTVAGATVQGSPAGGATVPGSPGGGSPASGLHVIPFPGTPDASRQSDVIFSSLTPSEIVSVAVTGSSSGGHTGTLRALPDAAGIAWVPDVPFSNSEQVSVTATLSSPAAGTASGAPGATTIRFAFRTATPFLPSPAGARGPVAQAASVADRAPASGPASLQKFVSEPGLHPVDVTATADPDQTSGDIFLTPRLTIHAPGRFGRHYHEGFMGGPMIINGRGQLVWFHPIKGLTYNLEGQRYRGSQSSPGGRRSPGRLPLRTLSPTSPTGRWRSSTPATATNQTTTSSSSPRREPL